MRNTKNKKIETPHFTKEDANRKSSVIFIQLGLVLALLLAYIAIESKTLVDNSTTDYIPPTYEKEDMIPDTTPEEPKQEKLKEKVIPIPIIADLDIIDNDTDTKETNAIFSSDPEFDKPIVFSIDSIPEVYIPEKETEDFIDIQDAPLFPGCKGTKKELKQCFSDSVKKLVGRKFNGEIAQEIGLTAGKKRISVQFTVDKQGNIADVLVRAPHKRLEKEARRVVGLLPKMTPGKQRGRPVGVKFTLPITFMVE